jgi:hypothetical protein
MSEGREDKDDDDVLKRKVEGKFRTRERKVDQRNQIGVRDGTGMGNNSEQALLGSELGSWETQNAVHICL